MARTERSTKAQAQAYRFGIRRLQNAVQYGTTGYRLSGGPRHGMSVLIGAVIAAVLVAGFLVYGFIRPAPSIKDAKVIVDTDEGTPYVVRDGVAYPALNLASAKLAALGEPGSDDVRRVRSATMKNVPKGQSVGIPGAPQHLPSPEALTPATFTVCDQTLPDPGAAPGRIAKVKTTVIVGQPAPSPAQAEPAPAILATLDGKTFWVVHAGVRSRVDVSDSVLRLSLGVERQQARRVSRGLMNIIPEGEPLQAVTIPGRGRGISVGGQRLSVGDVVQIEGSDGARYLVLLRNGWQEVSPVVADAVRAQFGSRGSIPLIAAADLPGSSRTELAVDGYPVQRLTQDNAASVLCIDYRRAGDQVRRDLYQAPQIPMPAEAKPVPVAPGIDAPSTGSADEVYVPPGSGLAVTQSPDGVTDTGSLFLITDQGMRFPVVDRQALGALGLTSTSPVTGDVLSLLPMGPTLDPSAARRFFAEWSAARADATSPTPTKSAKQAAPQDRLSVGQGD